MWLCGTRPAILRLLFFLLSFTLLSAFFFGEGSLKGERLERKNERVTQEFQKQDRTLSRIEKIGKECAHIHIQKYGL